MVQQLSSPSDQQKANEDYDRTVKEILTVMRDSDLTMDEAQFVGKLCFARMQVLCSTIDKSLEISKMDAQERVFGKPLGHMTMKEMDDVLALKDVK